MRHDTHDRSSIVQFHDFGGLKIVDAFIVERDAIHASQYFVQIERQVRISGKPFGEILSHCSLSLNSSSWIIKKPHDKRREEFNVVGIVPHDGVEIVRIPRRDPFPC